MLLTPTLSYGVQLYDSPTATTVKSLTYFKPLPARFSRLIPLFGRLRISTRWWEVSIALSLKFKSASVAFDFDADSHLLSNFVASFPS